MSQAGAPHLAHAFAARFLGSVPGWYKASILGFLVLNPVLFGLDPYVAGWALVLEFIGTLALALRCYPLQPGGLLALEAVLIGMTTPGRVYEETVAGVEVILLLIFMVAGVYFLKELLLTVFTKLVVGTSTNHHSDNTSNFAPGLEVGPAHRSRLDVEEIDGADDSAAQSHGQRVGGAEAGGE